eukprot:COSAG01_NODE_3568_length_5925_cov_4.034844_2_plen_145_part_00
MLEEWQRRPRQRTTPIQAKVQAWRVSHLLSCMKTDPAGPSTCISPGIGADTQMWSLGPRGLRGSRCEPGTTHVPELPQVSTYEVARTYAPHCEGTHKQPRRFPVARAIRGGWVRTIYQTILRHMHTSGKGWRMHPAFLPGSAAP